MRIAVTKSTLRIPPTYFAIDHARLLADRHEFQVFTLAAEVRDESVTVPVRDFVPFRSLPFRQRELTIPLFLPAMTGAISRYRPDVIHQHFATWSKPAADASARSGRPLLTTLHGADVMMALREPRTAMERWHHRNVRLASDRSSRLLAVSEYLAGRAVAAGFDPAKLVVHYQGIDTDIFTPAEGPRDSSASPLVVFVGALNEDKGVRDLVEASLALAATAEHRLVIAGGGPLETELRERAAGSEHIRFAGRIDRSGVRELLREADVFVLTSREHRGRREPAGLVLLEAQASGVPVLTYDSGGMPEMVRAGETGLVVPEADREALRDGLRELLSLRPEERRRMGEAARAFVVAERSLAVSAEQLERHYEEVAAGR